MHRELPDSVMFSPDMCGPGPQTIKDPEAYKPDRVNRAKLDDSKGAEYTKNCKTDYYPEQVGTDLQDPLEEAQGLTITNASEEEQLKVKNLIDLKTLEQEGACQGAERKLGHGWRVL